jgi:hypothetical protein
LRIHHALYDAVSLSALMHRFARLCGPDKREQPALPRYNWSKVLMSSQSEDSMVARKEFWTEYLDGAESVAPYSGTAEQFSDSRVSLVRRAALHQVPAITEACRARGVSLQALFFAAYARLLAPTGGRRVVFGVYLANRDEGVDAGANLYPLLRLVPLRVVLREGTGLFDVAVEIQKDIHAISSVVNVDVGLWEVKDWTGTTVDSFVNFLGASPDASDGEENGVQLKVADALEDDFTPTSDGSGESNVDQGIWRSSELASNPVRDTFTVSSLPIPPDHDADHLAGRR